MTLLDTQQGNLTITRSLAEHTCSLCGKHAPGHLEVRSYIDVGEEGTHESRPVQYVCGDCAQSSLSGDWKLLVDLFMHPLAKAAIAFLSEFGKASPKEICVALDIPKLSNLAYHVRALERLGLVEKVGTEPVRGAIKNYYVLCSTPLARAIALAIKASGDSEVTAPTTRAQKKGVDA